MKNTTIAYLAGVIDSDGTIGIKRSTYSMRVTKDSTQPTYSERIHVRQVERGAIELLAETFGGGIGRTKASTPNGRPLFNWGVTDKKAASALTALRPYLRIKARQADNCLALRAIKDKSKIERVAVGRGHAGAAVRSSTASGAMETAYLRAKELNAVGI